MAKYTGGMKVNGGYYWNAKGWESRSWGSKAASSPARRRRST